MYIFFYIPRVYKKNKKILFSCLRKSSLSCIQRFFSKMKLVKTLFRTQLKQTNLVNRFHISTESLKKRFNDIFFNIWWMN